VDHEVVSRLVEHGIQPSAQRVAVARFVLATDKHPSADQVLEQVGRDFPYISRATVYNTLNLFVEKGLIRAHTLAEGKVVFDPMMEPHHHFIDDETGEIHDVPWKSLKVSGLGQLKNFAVRGYEVVIRGQRRGRK
jgi:Fe2+ or Zn2+ uptake regulation protein